MTSELNSYQRGLAVKALVLTELAAGGPISGDELVGRIESRCEELEREVEGFSFLGWLGTTVWGAFDSFAEGGLLSHTGRRPASAQGWREAMLRIEPSGERFLEIIGNSAPQALRVLERKVASCAAAG